MMNLRLVSRQETVNGLEKALHRAYQGGDSGMVRRIAVLTELSQGEAVSEIADMQGSETSHIERWNNTLRQSNARFVRNTLSFSKSDFYHELVTRLYISDTTCHLLFDYYP